MNKMHVLLFSLLVIFSLMLLALCSCSSSLSTNVIISATGISTTPQVPLATTGIPATASSSIPSGVVSTGTTNSPVTSPASNPPPGTALSSGPAPNSNPKIVIELTAQNMAFDKSTLTAPAGAQVTINFTNQDKIGHNFAVYADQSAKTPIFIGQIINGPATVTYTFTTPSTPGSYLFHCVPHAGFMKGQFVVQ